MAAASLAQDSDELISATNALSLPNVSLVIQDGVVPYGTLAAPCIRVAAHSIV